MFSRLSSFSRFVARRAAGPRIARRRRITVEGLEPRLALAANPVAVDDNVFTLIGVPIDITAIANDEVSDAGDPLDPATIDIETPPTRGTVAVDPVSGVINYTPDPFFPGTDTFTYDVRDTSTASTTNEARELISLGGGPEEPGSVWKYLDDGSDQGTAWQEPDFDDSAWQSGPSQLGYGDGDENTQVDCGPGEPGVCAPAAGAPDNYITTYFRHTFQLEDASKVRAYRIYFGVDDGLAIHLNGERILRFNLDRDVPFNVPATGSGDNALRIADFTEPGFLALLVNGDNTFAVEVHQRAPNSSDISFDMAFLVVEEVAAGRESNEATVTIDIVDPNPTASNDSAQAQQGRPATINVLANDAVGFAGDPLDPATVQIVSPPSHGTAQVDPVSGAITYTSEGGFVGADSFSYRVQDSSTENGAIHTMLLPRGSVWKYLDTGPANPDPNWYFPSFDDTAWASGPAELGYGDPPNGVDAGGTVINCGASAPTCNQGNIITYYFRRAIDIADPATVDRLNVFLRRDDGAVIYVNGVEVLRDNMPVGTILPTTLGVAADDDGEDYTLHEISAATLAGALVPGQNIIAVEVHQSDALSSDVSFDLELIGTDQFLSGHPSNVATVEVNVTPITSTGCSQADLSGDGRIGNADLSLLVRNYGAVSVAAGTFGDLDNNGWLGLRDLRMMRALMGQNCTGGSPAAAPDAAIAEAPAVAPRRARVALRALAAPAVDRVVATQADDAIDVPRQQSNSSVDSAASTARLRASRQPSANRTTPADNPLVGL
jgi:hypothetical protein